MSGLTRSVVWLNSVSNALGRIVLAPIGAMPGWLSATLVAILTGVLMLVMFKYTSHQRAIKQVRNRIKANLLALKLFKDNTAAVVRSQVGLVTGALRLLGLSLVPMLVMLVPVTLLMTQLALWYQASPLRVGDATIVTLALNRPDSDTLSQVQLQSSPGIEIVTGPVRIPSTGEVCWSLRATESGYPRLMFRLGEQEVEKELAVGDGYMRVSMLRPSWSWIDVLLHPAEPPFRPESLVKSIAVDYPKRRSWTSGTDHWVIYWLVVSMAVAFILRPILKVNV